MKIKGKDIKEKDIYTYIQEHNGRPTDNEVLLAYANAPERKGYIEYYEFDDGGLLFVMKNLNGKDATLYFDKDAYVKNMLKIREWNTRTPLDKHQDIIQNLSPHIGSLISELYTKLKMESNIPVQAVDLEKLDKAIKKYGYEKAYEDLYLNLIVFGGEYIKAKVGGNWITERSEKNELVPIFIDGKKEKHKLDFWIAKDVAKYNRLNMRAIIGVELHGNIFQVVPNPTLRHPNEK